LKRLLSPFVLVLTAILALVYAYLAARLASGAASMIALGVPVVLIWLVPVVYWVGDRDRDSFADAALHFASYLSMGWLNFAFFLSLARDVLQVATAPLDSLTGPHTFLVAWGGPLVLGGSVLALAAGALAALRGPSVRRVDIPIEGLDPALEGLRIVQISDLHVGYTIGGRYVRRVARMANELAPDLVALTGDMVDGTIARLGQHVAPLATLQPAGRVFFITGNHEYYSGAEQWIAHFRSLGCRVLLNEYAVIDIRGARVLVGGVVDPAARSAGPAHVPRADLAAGSAERVALRVLLAHNPKLAPLGEAAGFDLQLSGHTHAGQFFPWTLAVRLIHAPHAAGVSRSGRMWVYVSAGTGSWGPPVRLGTEPELTLIRLVRAAGTEPAAKGPGL
jgi:predicted MPP superfamily phosphohydrolase